MVVYQRNKLILGTRAFDEKPTPAARRDEYVEPTENERATRKKKGTLVAVQRLLAHRTHMYVLGMSRAGKSASTVLPAIEQMLLPFDESWMLPGGEKMTRENRSALVVIDAKADKAFRNSVDRMAVDAGRLVQSLTLSPYHSWRFNPLAGFTGRADDAANLSANLLTSLNLDLGGGYGANFFTVQTLSLLFDVCNHLSSLKRAGKSPTIGEAIRYIKKHARAAPRDSDSLLSTLNLLSHLPHLQPADDDPHVIQMVDAILNRHVVIVSVDALNQGPVARLVAGLVLSATLAAATRIANEHSGDPSPLPHTFCVIDEFHHLVSRNAQNILTGAAGVGLTFCLCTQSVDTMKLRDLDLSQVVWDNCGIKCLHSCFGEQDVRNLQALSRDTIRPLGSRTAATDFRYFGRRAFDADTESDRIEPLLTRREIQETSAKTNRCFVVVSAGQFEEPIITDTYFAESHEQHLVSRVTPWPESPSLIGRESPIELTTPSLGGGKQPRWLAAHLAKNKAPVHAERITRFENLLSKLRDEEMPGNLE
ncbi:hypothetical protein KOR34_23980 [Posidoniimonas corsicana]|uniref:AAA-like domain protein n=1 Tax=Posidoniimonas corsicana TaxID=1938618 RepID=A0A5C5VHJ2_9BACT|nr:hypothetical protein [Posidoniimonas corsicana]TWT37447.1 hypothetical protein KOR34_23980 [Posidoniimonas corsicana]